MNKSVESYMREGIKSGLALCSEREQMLFKRMYSHQNLELDINSIVGQMPSEKLERAFDQVERTNMKFGRA